jgi:hypothetical protein
MGEMIAYCGIVCSDCPAYVATQSGDTEELKRVAEEWSGEDMQLSPYDLVCDGCLLGHARYALFCSSCETRSCAIAREVENCAHCEEYACDKLARTFEMVPDAKTRLDVIHAAL